MRGEGMEPDRSQSGMRSLHCQMKTKLGNISIEVGVGAIKNQAAVVESALRYALFHKAAGIAFKKSKDGSGHKRDDAYSADLAGVVKAAIEKVLGEMFETCEIGVGEHVAAEKQVAFTPAQVMAMMEPGADVPSLLRAWGMAPKPAPAPALDEAGDEDSDLS